MTPAYMGWSDPNPKKPTALKLAEAIDHFRRTRGHEPAGPIAGEIAEP